jgi:hypothetical protein
MTSPERRRATPRRLVRVRPRARREPRRRARSQRPEVDRRAPRGIEVGADRARRIGSPRGHERERPRVELREGAVQEPQRRKIGAFGVVEQHGPRRRGGCRGVEELEPREQDAVRHDQRIVGLRARIPEARDELRVRGRAARLVQRELLRERGEHREGSVRVARTQSDHVPFGVERVEERGLAEAGRTDHLDPHRFLVRAARRQRTERRRPLALAADERAHAGRRDGTPRRHPLEP